MTEKKWSCDCGFTTHNEDVWIEPLHWMHLKINQKENPVELNRIISRPVYDNHTPTPIKGASFYVSARSTSEKNDKKRKKTRFKTNTTLEDKWQYQEQKLAITIAVFFAIPVIFVAISNFLSPFTPHGTAIVDPSLQYIDFAKLMFTEILLDPVKGRIPRESIQASPLYFRFVLKSDWMIMPVKVNKAIIRADKLAVDNDDQDSNEKSE